MKDCSFRPHVVGVRAGQELWVRNVEQEEAHNLLLKIGATKLLNTGAKAQGKEVRLGLDPAMGLQAKCEIHPWMSARIHVLEHPYFCMTGSEDSTIHRLPPGSYTLSVWHETFRGVDVTVVVKEGETTMATFELR